MAGIPNVELQFFPLARGNAVHLGSFAMGVARLPCDPIGNFTLTLTNLIVGSAIQIEDQAGTTTLHNQVCDATSETIVLSAYASGSPLNSLRIKVRKGSAAPYYRPFETLTTAIVGSQSIYIAQIPDD
jgi:hypothetical protein